MQGTGETGRDRGKLEDQFVMAAEKFKIYLFDQIFTLGNYLPAQRLLQNNVINSFCCSFISTMKESLS